MAFKKGNRDRIGADHGDTPAGPGGGLGRKGGRGSGRKSRKGGRY